MPSSVINIRDGAFSDCLRLTSLDIPHGLVEIGRWAFRNCGSIETIHIPSTVTAIGEGAFEGCERLKCTGLPPTLEIIEENLFHGCHKLEYIEIPTTVKRIGRKAFCHCKSLTNVRVPPSVEYIARTAFSYCGDLISIELPDRHFETDDEEHNLGIYDCNKLVNVPANPVLLGDWAYMETFLIESRIGNLVDSFRDFLRKSAHRFDKCPLNELCYYQSYYPSGDAMVQLHMLMEDDPLAATTQADEFGMTPLHILALSQTPNLSMLQTVMNGGRSDHIICCRDLFGFTPMDYLCFNKMPSSTQVIRSLLQAMVVKRVNERGLDWWKSDLLQAVDNVVAVDWSSRRREI
eukprot:scaffold490_cov54-Cylindrotheca_fusiformis.AAC.1